MRQLGIIQVLLSGLCFGFLGIFGKRAYALSLSPGEFLSLRFLLASGLLGTWLLCTNRRLLQIPLRSLAHCVLLGMLGYAVFSSCYFEALSGLSVSLTVLLLYTYPVVVCLGAWILFGEKLRRGEILALPFVSLGLAMLVWGDLEVRSGLSLLLGIGSSLFYSLYILASSRWLKNIPPLTTTFYIMLSAGITLSALHLRPTRFPLPLEAWWIVTATAVICTLLAMSLFLAGLQKLTSGETSLLSTAEPITAVALATIFWGEHLAIAQWLGGALVLSGMVLVARAQKR